jgi:hypothetical protein
MKMYIDKMVKCETCRNYPIIIIIGKGKDKHFRAMCECTSIPLKELTGTYNWIKDKK